MLKKQTKTYYANGLIGTIREIGGSSSGDKENHTIFFHSLKEIGFGKHISFPC